MSKTAFAQINGVAFTAFALCLLVGVLLSVTMHQPAPAIVGGLLGLYLLFAIKVVRQWEKVALLRLGQRRRDGLGRHRGRGYQARPPLTWLQ